MLNILISPKCYFKLKQNENYLQCLKCNITYKIINEIRIMIPPNYRENSKIQGYLGNIEYDYDKFICQTSTELL